MANAINPTKWVAKYSDYLYNYTITRVSDAEIARDLISETFLAGLKSQVNFKGEATERTWLIAILKRKIIDHYRKSNSRKGRAEVRMDFKDSDDGGNWMEDKVANIMELTAEDVMENEELGLAIFSCIDQLSERQAAIFKAKTIDEQDTEIICKDYGISPSNLWVIIHRARTSLMACLDDSWLK